MAELNQNTMFEWIGRLYADVQLQVDEIQSQAEEIARQSAILISHSKTIEILNA